MRFALAASGAGAARRRREDASIHPRTEVDCFLLFYAPPCRVIRPSLFRFGLGRPDRPKKAASERQLRRVSSLDVPACVVVRRGDASDKEVILQVRKERDAERERRKTGRERERDVKKKNGGGGGQARFLHQMLRKVEMVGLLARLPQWAHSSRSPAS